MSSNQTAVDKLSQILTDYCNSFGTKSPDNEKLKNLLSKVSDDQGYELLSSITDTDRYGDTVLTSAAFMGQTELCVTVNARPAVTVLT